MVDEKSNQSFNIGKIWKLKSVWETDHIGMRACVPPVRGFLVAGWHARTSRETGWILNSGVSATCCVIASTNTDTTLQVLTNMIRDRLFAFHSATITLFICVHMCACIYAIHDWILIPPLNI